MHRHQGLIFRMPYGPQQQSRAMPSRDPAVASQKKNQTLKRRSLGGHVTPPRQQKEYARVADRARELRGLRLKQDDMRKRRGASPPRPASSRGRRPPGSHLTRQRQNLLTVASTSSWAPEY